MTQAAPFAVDGPLAPPLARLLTYWEGLRRGQAEIPFWDDLSEVKIEASGAETFILDVFSRPERFRVNDLEIGWAACSDCSCPPGVRARCECWWAAWRRARGPSGSRSGHGGEAGGCRRSGPCPIRGTSGSQRRRPRRWKGRPQAAYPATVPTPARP